MQQLPAKTSPKWLALTAQGIAAVVLFAMTASLLPVLLITSLVGALVLIPVLRQLCKEVEQTARPKKNTDQRRDDRHNTVPSAMVVGPFDVLEHPQPIVGNGCYLGKKQVCEPTPIMQEPDRDLRHGGEAGLAIGGHKWRASYLYRLPTGEGGAGVKKF